MRDRADMLRAKLPDIGNGLQAAIATLYNAPEADACELLGARLQDAARHVLALSRALPHADPLTA